MTPHVRHWAPQLNPLNQASHSNQFQRNVHVPIHAPSLAVMALQCSILDLCMPLLVNAIATAQLPPRHCRLWNLYESGGTEDTKSKPEQFKADVQVVNTWELTRTCFNRSYRAFPNPYKLCTRRQMSMKCRQCEESSSFFVHNGVQCHTSYQIQKLFPPFLDFFSFFDRSSSVLLLKRALCSFLQ